MNKKERVTVAIEGRVPGYVPCGFSLYLPKERTTGEEAATVHLEFFEKMDTDIFETMNENMVSDAREVKVPSSWDRIPTYSLKDDLTQRQLGLVKRILDRCDRQAFLLGTLRDICASPIHPIEARYGYEGVRELSCRHIRENKKSVLKAWKRITGGMRQLVEAYLELGLDNIYYAGLGAETRYYTGEEFAECIEPFDKQILQVVREKGGYNFLHMCKDGLNIQRYASYRELVGMVSWGVYEAHFSLEEGRELFPGVTIMGSLANRSDVLTDGTEEELREAVREIITRSGKKGLILGADCTLTTEMPYEKIKAVIEAVRTIR